MGRHLPAARQQRLPGSDTHRLPRPACLPATAEPAVKEEIQLVYQRCHHSLQGAWQKVKGEITVYFRILSLKARFLPCLEKDWVVGLLLVKKNADGHHCDGCALTEPTDSVVEEGAFPFPPGTTLGFQR